MIILEYKVKEYLREGGANPVRTWLNSLPAQVSARIQARFFRLEAGNFGDFKSVGHGVMELRFSFGAGYRVYFGIDGKKIVILLCGGDKTTQRRDIIQARRYWLDYLSRGVK